jgi:8-oxo-dGTP diphosphatase
VKPILAKVWKKLSLPKGFQLSIMRLFQSEFLIGVTGIIFNDQNQVLLFKHTYRQNSWSLPGGYIKSREHPFEGLEREIMEESGLVISADEQIKLRTDRETSRLDISIIGKFIGGEFKPSHEVAEFGFFAFDNLPDITKNQLLLIKDAIDQNSIRE